MLSSNKLHLAGNNKEAWILLCLSLSQLIDNALLGSKIPAQMTIKFTILKARRVHRLMHGSPKTSLPIRIEWFILKLTMEDQLNGTQRMRSGIKVHILKQVSNRSLLPPKADSTVSRPMMKSGPTSQNQQIEEE